MKNRSASTVTNTEDDLEVLKGGITTAAKHLGVDPRTLYRAAASGQFPAAIRLGAKWIIPLAAWRRFLDGGDHPSSIKEKDVQREPTVHGGEGNANRG